MSHAPGHENKDFSTKGPEVNTLKTPPPQDVNKLVQDAVKIILNSSSSSEEDDSLRSKADPFKKENGGHKEDENSANNTGQISKGDEGKNKVRGTETKGSSSTPMPDLKETSSKTVGEEEPSQTEQVNIQEEHAKDDKRAKGGKERDSSRDDNRAAERLFQGMRKIFLATGIAGVGALGATVFALRAAGKVIQSTAHGAIQGLGNGFQRGRKLVGTANYRKLKGLKAPFTAVANLGRAIVRNPLTRFAGGAVGAVVGTAGGVIKGAVEGAVEGIWKVFGGGSAQTVSKKGDAEGGGNKSREDSRSDADKQKKAPKRGIESGKDADNPNVEGPGPGEAPKLLMDNAQGNGNAGAKENPEENGEGQNLAA